MKLLFDENLSSRLVRALASTYPGSRHVDEVELHGQPDSQIWRYAQQHSYALVSKDDDFRQLSFVYGTPPKVVWLAVGNAGSRAIATLLANRRAALESFSADPQESLFILT